MSRLSVSGVGIRGEQVSSVWTSDKAYSLEGGSLSRVAGTIPVGSLSRVAGTIPVALGFRLYCFVFRFRALESETIRFSVFGIQTTSILWRERCRLSCRGAHSRRSWAMALLFRVTVSGIGI